MRRRRRTEKGNWNNKSVHFNQHKVNANFQPKMTIIIIILQWIIVNEFRENAKVVVLKLSSLLSLASADRFISHLKVLTGDDDGDYNNNHHLVLRLLSCHPFDWISFDVFRFRRVRRRGSTTECKDVRY